MRHLFSPEGEAALRTFVHRDTLIAFDYDGTLSPIAPLPEQAYLSAGVARQLRELNELATVAIVTGRRVNDVGKRLLFNPAYLVGNHGLEGLPCQGDIQERSRIQCRAWIEQLLSSPALHTLVPGLVVEDKSLSLSIHYRLSRNRTEARNAISARLENLVPAPLIVGGPCVVNLLPSDAPGKGRALARLLNTSGRQNALYAGDDETDEEVFRCAPPDWLTVRVGYHPDSAARFFLNHQSEIGALLRSCISALRTPIDTRLRQLPTKNSMP